MARLDLDFLSMVIDSEKLTAQGTTMITLKGRTILVVDDEEGNREVMAEEFRMADATVIEAASGNIAFKILMAQKIDAVISDIRMADGDGVQLLDNVKANFPNMPVVMLITGFSDLSEENAYQKGAHAIFGKPCNLEYVVEAVYRQLLPNKERWVQPIDSTKEYFTIGLVSDSLVPSDTPQGRLLNIGRGGMFVCLEKLPKVGEKVKFSIRPSASASAIFKGTGICRWRRDVAKDDLPTGVGVEFQNLSEASVAALEEIFKSLTSVAFIPKGVKKI